MFLLSIPLYGFRRANVYVSNPAQTFQFHCMDSARGVHYCELVEVMLSIPLYGFIIVQGPNAQRVKELSIPLYGFA